jgi:hypothetical protein
MNYPDQKFVS